MTPAEVNQHIGQRVRAERRRQELTQAELAGLCGTTFQQIHKYESGAITISVGMLWRLAQALGVRVTDLFPQTRWAHAPEDEAEIEDLCA